ncbi:hypothetical protein COCCADRAFT_41681 [Bipolaris zeicola 26-R-13]|uniref:Uncharacterized protein n=1 Tax=Cochliobolus carbonum (strain 26-R-13) TaxID=930089 RepID=W6XK88_COCC2|nr:uncharacterized protein COCCADRAFT_41681 [Bipolaris zeicola 26-R-13]EUC27642.1 hypothetical protein COCCADRAFT_41681 [Bipolaris zeicola 26-R-13]
MGLIPVNFKQVRYSRLDGRPYFQHPEYPEFVQFVVNGEWVSIHVLSIKPEMMDENIKGIVQEAKKLLFQDQSVTDTLSLSQRPTLPPLQSSCTNMSSEIRFHKTVEECKTTQREFLHVPNSGPSVSTRKNSYSQATTDSHHPRSDYYSMPSNIL